MTIVNRMQADTIHIVGAGLAGLAAALELSGRGRKILIHEAANHAGGRCRSFQDDQLGCRIDNGNHLMLSANRDALWLMESCGAMGSLVSIPEPDFAFFDLTNGRRWHLRPGVSRLPWWILSEQRRVPETSWRDYLAPLRLRGLGRSGVVEAAFDTNSQTWRCLWRPFAIAALNTEPEHASAELLWNVITESFGRGGQALRPLLPQEGLSESLVDPAIAELQRRGVEFHFGHRLRGLMPAGDSARIAALIFTSGEILLGEKDAVILAIPAQHVSALGLPISAPDEFRPIVNAHFRFPHRLAPSQIVGVIGGLTEWIFPKPGILSITVSEARHVVDVPAEQLAPQFWNEICRTLALKSLALPPWRVVKEKRATFAATPEQERKRPLPQTAWRNLFLAGDWTKTGLPATIEGAIRSGRRAAQQLR